jgi:hypothetical protein
MSKINHERPYLKYIDNIRREIKKSSSFSSKEPEIDPSTARDTSIGQRLWNKMLQINLTEPELEKISELLRLLNEHSQTQCKWLELLMKPKEGKQKKALEKEMEQLKLSMISIAIQIIALEAIARNDGREKGIFDWLNLLGKHMTKNGAEDGWYFLSETVFKVANEAFSYLLENPNIVHNKFSQGTR